MHELLKLDRQAFFLINHAGQNGLFDALMPLLRHAYFWAPFYTFLLIYVVSNFKKNVLLWILFSILLVTMTNYISSDFIKHFIFRLRPCNDTGLIPPARLLLSYKPQSSGFTSSHATNHFAMAVFFFVTMRKQTGNWGLLFFVWALLIGYAQVYVGVHYPLDIIGGALVGSGFGLLFAYIFKRVGLSLI